MIVTTWEDVDWPAPVAIEAHRVLVGSPEASTVVLHADEHSELGLWQVSPGDFTTRHAGYVEFVTIASGRGRLVGQDGTVTELHVGVSALLEEGWTGRWVVDEPIVKSYAVIPVQSSSQDDTSQSQEDSP